MTHDTGRADLLSYPASAPRRDNGVDPPAAALRAAQSVNRRLEGLSHTDLLYEICIFPIIGYPALPIIYVHVILIKFDFYSVVWPLI